MSTWRHLELSSERLPRWWDRFSTDHPGVELTTFEGAAVLTSTNGSIARFTGWFPITDALVSTAADPEANTSQVIRDVQARLLDVPARIGIVLVRRGGYAIGLAQTGPHGQLGLVAHKCGTRYVQGRTAAGGQSQQRFARRRGNQAEDLVRATADRGAAVLEPILARATTDVGLVVGGDPAMVERVIADPRLSHVSQAPRREYFDLPDPRFRVLTDVAGRASKVSVAVHNPI